MLQMVTSEHELAELVQVCGFLPLLKNQIPGFSVEEHTPPDLWFVDGVDGPWEWKGPVIRATGCAYGKFFWGKAGFISAEWFPDFANYRRDGYDFDARYDDGLAKHQDKMVYDVLADHPSLLSKEWRRLCGIGKRGEFDSIVSRPKQRFIQRLLGECTTGKDRIAAPLLDKAGVTIAHKTGSGYTANGILAAHNDVAHICLPGGVRYTLAVFVKDFRGNEAQASRVAARISAAVYAVLAEKGRGS